jgi:hypothetical protein
LVSCGELERSRFRARINSSRTAREEFGDGVACKKGRMTKMLWLGEEAVCVYISKEGDWSYWAAAGGNAWLRTRSNSGAWQSLCKRELSLRVVVFQAGEVTVEQVTDGRSRRLGAGAVSWAPRPPTPASPFLPKYGAQRNQKKHRISHLVLTVPQNSQHPHLS